MNQYQTLSPYWLPLLPPVETLTPQQCYERIVSDNDIINIGTGNQIIGGGGNPSPVTVTDVTTETYTALATDYFLCVDVAAPVTITLPTGILGTVYFVKDCGGTADTNIITIQGTGGELIDDAATALIDSPFGALQLVFTGTGWSIA